MTQAESIMELVALIGPIEETGNYLYLRIRAKKDSYPIYALDKATEDINIIRRKLEAMGVRDIPFHHPMTLEVNYRYAIGSQKEVLDAIMEAKCRFDALSHLYNNGGIQPTAAETAYFQKLDAERAASRAKFMAQQKSL